MTKQQFLSATLNQVSQVYFGKRDCCRCGCGGDYTATSFMVNPPSFMVNPRSGVNDSLVEKRLKRAQHLVESGADVNYGETYVDVETGKNRTLTFYFDEIRG
jgi:hypothetical protein